MDGESMVPRETTVIRFLKRVICLTNARERPGHRIGQSPLQATANTRAILVVILQLSSDTDTCPSRPGYYPCSPLRVGASERQRRPDDHAGGSEQQRIKKTDGGPKEMS